MKEALECALNRLGQPDRCTGRLRGPLEALYGGVSNGVSTVIIGLGGLGAEALTAARREIALTCGPAEGRVSYLYLDSDHRDCAKRSAQDCAPWERLTADESVYLSMEGFTGGMTPWCSSWFRDPIPLGMPVENGSGAHRQWGRLALFRNVEQVMDKLLRTVRRSAEPGSPIQIYLLTGLTGGFGGGAFLDVAYLARLAASKAEPGRDVTVTGCIFLPDGGLHHVPEEVGAYQRANAYAALQELDHLMVQSAAGMAFRQQYADNIVVDTVEPPVDAVFLLGPAPEEPDDDTRRRNIDAVAQFLVNQVCRETGEDWAGSSAKQYQQMVLHSRNIQINSRPRNRYYGYLAVGTVEHSLPVDKLCVRVLERALAQLNHEDAEVDLLQEAQRLLDTLGLAPQQLLPELVQRVPFDPEVGKRPTLEQVNRHCQEVCHQAAQRGQEVCARRGKSFEERVLTSLKDRFCDPRRGPRWGRLLLDNLIKLLDGLLQELYQREMERYGQLGKREGELHAMLQELEDNWGRAAFRPARRARMAEEFYRMADDYAWEQAELACIPVVRRLLEHVKEAVGRLNAERFAPMEEGIGRLDENIRHGILCMNNAEANGHFRDRGMDSRPLAELVRSRVDLEPVAHGLYPALWQWMEEDEGQRPEFDQALWEYLNDQVAQRLLSRPDVLELALGDRGERQTLEELLSQAQLRLAAAPDPGVETWKLITLPGAYAALDQAARNLPLGNGRIQRVDSPVRLCVQQILCGFALFQCPGIADLKAANHALPQKELRHLCPEWNSLLELV